VLTDGSGEFSRQKTSPAMVDPSSLSLRSLGAGPGDRCYLVRSRGNSAGRGLRQVVGARDPRVLTHVAEKLRKSHSATATYIVDLDRRTRRLRPMDASVSDAQFLDNPTCSFAGVRLKTSATADPVA